MLKEIYFETALRWHLYRKWRRPPRPSKQAEYEFHRVMRKLPSGSLFLDLGANVGHVTKHALDYGMQVIAFEPDPEARQILTKRFGDNRNLTIIPKAVGGSARTATFYQSSGIDVDVDRTQGSSIFETSHNGTGRSFEVEVVDIVQFLHGKPVAVIKMDIEGAEVECIEAILDAGIHRSIERIFVETHEGYVPDLAARTGKLRHRIAREGISNINLDWG